MYAWYVDEYKLAAMYVSYLDDNGCRVLHEVEANVTFFRSFKIRVDSHSTKFENFIRVHSTLFDT